MSSSSPRRKCSQSQTRETIANVYNFLENDAKEILQLVKNPIYNAGPVLITELAEHLNRVRYRTAQATKVSERTVTRIMAEAKESKFKTPYKDRKRPTKKLKSENKEAN